MNPSNGVVRFETNIPQILVLKYMDGLEVEGRYGAQVMWTLADERKLYVPPIVARKIENCGVRPGEQFSICKREIRNGQRRSIDYQIERLSEFDIGDSEPETELEQDLRRSAEIARAARAPVRPVPVQPISRAPAAPVQPLPRQPAPVPSPRQSPPAAASETAPMKSGPANPTTRAVVPAPPTTRPMNGAGETAVDIMARSYESAISIALRAVAYAESKGLRVTPVFEDIRAMAATLVISETGGRR